MTTTRLTDKSVKNAKPQEINNELKDCRYPDGGGLYLLATATGGKLWRYNFSMDGKKYVLPLGKYPALSLKDAREAHKEAVNQIAKGINPVEERRAKKQKAKKEAHSTFKEIAEEFIQKKSATLSHHTIKRYKNSLAKDFYPVIGDRTINTIERHELVKIAQNIQGRGAVESAYRVLNVCNQIWRYALQLDKVKHNIVADISKNDVLKPFKNNQFRTITDSKRIGELMRALEAYHGEYSTKYALLFLAHTFVRSKNIRFAEWKEIDLDNKVWTIPAEKMKAGEEHRLPLSDQAISILKEIEPYTRDAKFIFPSPLNKNKPLSDMALSTALKRIDFGSEIVPHGFRAMFSTLAYESGKFRGEVIEALLSHKDPNEVRRAYNRANYEEEKRAVITWWGDFLEVAKSL